MGASDANKKRVVKDTFKESRKKEKDRNKQRERNKRTKKGGNNE